MEKGKSMMQSIKQKVISTALVVSANITATIAAHSDAFDSATKATTTLQNNIVKLCKVLFPFSLVILIVAILFTHDQKALQVELKTALLICLAYVALLIITGSGFLDTFTNLVGG